MGDSLFTYIERLQVMVFFAGYPIIYMTVLVIAGKKADIPGHVLNCLKRSLPFAYALSASLYLGFVARNLYPDYSIHQIASLFQYPYLTIYGLLAILFWIPVLSKRPVLCLLHSLVLFFFVVKDIILLFTSSIDRDMIKNDMSILTNSLLLNIVTLAASFIVIIIRLRLKTRSRID